MKKLIVAVIPFLLFIQPAFADVLIQNDQPYIDDDGTLHIVGEIENNTTVPLNQIIITISKIGNPTLCMTMQFLIQPIHGLNS